MTSKIAEPVDPAKKIEAGQPERSQSAVWITLAFLALLCLTVWRHEMFRDELQPWLIALNASSIAELFHNLRYEGHPPLWYLLLYVLSRFADQPGAMQALQVMIASASVYIMARYSPFAAWQKVLLAFGYFPLYEYGTFAKYHSLCVLLIFISCALFPMRRDRWLAMCGLLFLLANTTAYGWMISLALGIVILIDRLANCTYAVRSPAFRWKTVAGACIIVMGLAVSAWQATPAPGTVALTGWRTGLSISATSSMMSTVAGSHFLVPDVLNQWDWILHKPPIINRVQAVAGTLILGFMLCVFLRRRMVLLLYSIATLAVLGFTYTKFHGKLTHHGHLFLILVACLWLAHHYGEVRPGGWMGRLSDFGARWGRGFFALVLVVHFVCGLGASARDWMRPFSNSKAAARFISRMNGDMPILGDGDLQMTPVCGYLNRSMYYPVRGQFGTFTLWNRVRHKATEEELRRGVERMVESEGEVLVVLNYELDDRRVEEIGVDFLVAFTGAIVEDENYWLYLARQHKEHRNAD